MSGTVDRVATPLGRVWSGGPDGAADGSDPAGDVEAVADICAEPADDGAAECESPLDTAPAAMTAAAIVAAAVITAAMIGTRWPPPCGVGG
ncbi:conserved hypothetical protein [Streptomyces pristinaespiralis ATCC 25486]|uniref:Uncharacterized protein n=1 Tax=Streptomyces pristinaespiralis (strain ATCC 25486 / DSM 40338 / CBS 914.69 / JCM 4507 / KCC S-0507 / NBRC 13074 / NRRL 2958 / 5647) TaxID=457429 RepID=B5H972_STRE2|nr:conserved hypothetical protein [Streptomyces pristinaespiralis ATCC 25486]